MDAWIQRKCVNRFEAINDLHIAHFCLCMDELVKDYGKVSAKPFDVLLIDTKPVIVFAWYYTYAA